MTKRQQMIECMHAMEEGMERTGPTREDIWQNGLIWWLCKSVFLILEWIVKKEK